MPPAIQAPVKCQNLRDVSLGRFLGLIASLLIVSLSLARAFQSVTLAWNASPGSDVAGYKVYYGTTSGSSSQTLDAGNVTTVIVSNLNDATTYFFSVTAYNAARLESQRSNEVSYTTPSPPSPPLTLYSLTVNKGSGSGNYPAGAEVPVSANAPAPGQQFEVWDGDYAILADLSSSSTTALIPLRNVTITATYSALPTYGVTVTNGTGDGNYLAGAQVTVIADAAPAGQQFAGWTGNVTFANPSSPTTTFTMPSSVVAVTATYAALPTYGVTVTNGTGDGDYLAGAQVTVIADPAPAGQRFAGWTGNVTFANPSLPTTTFTMPSSVVAVTATYADLPKYALTVINGTGDGTYPAGTQVTVRGNLFFGTGGQFVGWIGDVVYLADPSSRTTTLTMPSAPVTISATFQ